MKRTLVLLTLSLWLLSLPTWAEGDTGIRFETGTWKEILAKAKAQNKLVFLDAYTTWCGPCKMMSKQVFPQQEVGDFYNANFVNAKIDMEKGEGVDLANQYAVKAYPSLIYVDGDGKIMHRSLGARDAQAFIELGKVALDPNNRLASHIERYEKGDRSPEALYKYTNALWDTGEDYSKAMREYFATQKPEELTSQRNWEGIKRWVENTEDREFQYLIKQRDAFRKAYGTDVDEKIKEVYHNSLMATLRATSPATRDVKLRLEKFQAAKNELLKSSYEQASQIASSAEMTAYRMLQDWPAYGKATVDHFSKYPPTDANELNEAAWAFYEHITDKKLLASAEKYAAKANSLSPDSYAYQDTYAAVLYKLGKKKLAQTWAEKAIRSGEKAGEDVSETKAMLAKIKALK